MKPLVLALGLLTSLAAASGATYQVGNIVSNFTLFARHAFTNDGRVFASNAPVQLHDFAGKIIFIEFFAYW